MRQNGITTELDTTHSTMRRQIGGKTELLNSTTYNATARRYSKNGIKPDEVIQTTTATTNRPTKCSEYCETVSGKNKLLDRKLQKEMKYYSRQMKTECRLMGDKQRALKSRHDRLTACMLQIQKLW